MSKRSTTFDVPTAKKRKLNRDGDCGEEDDIEALPPKRRVRKPVLNRSTSNTNDDIKESSNITLAESEQELNLILNHINGLTMKGLKALLDRMEGLEIKSKIDCTTTGRKPELLDRVRSNIKLIFTTQQYQDFQRDISQFVLLSRYLMRSMYIGFTCHTDALCDWLVICSESEGLPILSFGTKLTAFSKEEIIHHLEWFLNSREDGSSLQKEFVATMPAIDLEPALREHSKLLKHMLHADRDNQGGIETNARITKARFAIHEYGLSLYNSSQWRSCLEYLVATIDEVGKYHTNWKDELCQCSYRELKKDLRSMLGVVKDSCQQFGVDIDDEMRQKVENVEEMLEFLLSNPTE